jgi:hypothetical protein
VTGGRSVEPLVTNHTAVTAAPSTASSETGSCRHDVRGVSVMCWSASRSGLKRMATSRMTATRSRATVAPLASHNAVDMLISACTNQAP